MMKRGTALECVWCQLFWTRWENISQKAKGDCWWTGS